MHEEHMYLRFSLPQMLILTYNASVYMDGLIAILYYSSKVWYCAHFTQIKSIRLFIVMNLYSESHLGQLLGCDDKHVFKVEYQ